MEAMKSVLAWMWTLHLLLALWLSTGVFASAVVLAQVKRARDRSERFFGIRLVWRLMTVFIVPGVLITGALGFYLVSGFQYGFALGWVKASIVLYLLVLGGILFYQVPHFRKAVRAGEAGDTGELDRLALAKGPAMLTHLIALAIVVMIILMAMKPTP
jgi:uncharacterized membrane protein